MSDAGMDHARALRRAWAEAREGIVGLLPDRSRDAFMVRPQNWLDAAWARITAEELAGAAPEALIGAVGLAASYGLAPYDGKFVPTPEGGATFVPSVSAMKAALLACDLSTVLCDVVRPGDGLDVTRNRAGDVIAARHDKRAGGDDADFTQVWAFCGFYHQRGYTRETILLDRAEVEGLAAYRMHVPVPEPMHQAARRIALILLAERLPMEPAWAPVRRWRAIVQPMWRTAAPQREQVAA